MHPPNKFRQLLNKLLLFFRFIKPEPPPKVNIELLLKVRQHLIDHPETYSYMFFSDVTTNGKPGPCGCVAYHACVLSGSISEIPMRGTLCNLLDNSAYVSFNASRALGIRDKPEYRDLLFIHHPKVADEDFVEEDDDTSYHHVQVLRAIRAIEHVLDMEGYIGPR